MHSRIWNTNVDAIASDYEAARAAIDDIHATYDMTCTGFRDSSDLAAVIMQAIA
jgi:hypothetical protein